MYEVRQINKRPESIFVVEGYMDVIGLFQHGVKNAVASSGTAFTQEQLRKILNYTNTIYIVFDGDEAGLKASWRTVENSLPLLREDTRISFIFLKEGEPLWDVYVFLDCSRCFPWVVYGVFARKPSKTQVVRNERVCLCFFLL